MDGLEAIERQLERIAAAAEITAVAAKSFAASAATIAEFLSKQNFVGPEATLAPLEISQGESKMTEKAKATGPTLIIDTANMRLYAIGLDALGAKGAQLASGASIAVTASPTGVLMLTPDSPSLPDPSGTPSVYSAAIAPVNPPETGVPVTLTAIVTNADGTTQTPVTAQVQFTPGTEASLELEEL